MARRYEYSSEEIRGEFRRLRDRLYRQARRGGFEGAYEAVKQELSEIDYIDEDVLDWMQTVFEQEIDVNKVDPYKYDERQYVRVRDMLLDMMGRYAEFPWIHNKLEDCVSIFDQFVNDIGTYAFSNFIDNNPEVIENIERIPDIYFSNESNEEADAESNAMLSSFEYMFMSYCNSDAYYEYKAWERQMSAQFEQFTVNYSF